MPFSDTRPFVQDVVLSSAVDFHHRAALADFLVVHDVEGAVFPDGHGGGVGLGVHVAGFGVHGAIDVDADFAGDDF